MQENRAHRITKPLNEAEKKLFETLTEDGWEILTRGWPDFACFKDDKLMLIEVKALRSHSLKKEQHRILVTFAKLGLDCFRWSPDVGFERITAATPIPPEIESMIHHRKPLSTAERQAIMKTKLSPKQLAKVEELEKQGKDWW